MSDQNLSGLLYGKPLHSLVTAALISLETKNSKDILLKTIVEEILIKRPELRSIIDKGQIKKYFISRVRNCVDKLSESKLVLIEKRKTEFIDYSYIIIIPKFL